MATTSTNKKADDLQSQSASPATPFDYTALATEILIFVLFELTLYLLISALRGIKP